MALISTKHLHPAAPVVLLALVSACANSRPAATSVLPQCAACYELVSTIDSSGSWIYTSDDSTPTLIRSKAARPDRTFTDTVALIDAQTSGKPVGLLKEASWTRASGRIKINQLRWPISQFWDLEEMHGDSLRGSYRSNSDAGGMSFGRTFGRRIPCPAGAT